MQKNYPPQQIETSIQNTWENQKHAKAKEDNKKAKFYCLSMLPYPSGEMHMGHVRNYTIGDVIARYQRMLGKNVLQPMGWDAFGLPAENAAIQNKIAPATWTYQNIEILKKQLKRLGFAIDWDRELTTCKPTYYHWEQWLFIQLYKKGIVYRKNSKVNWDPVDQTVLANEQVINGRGWRSGALIEQKEIPQWFFKITAYADELLSCLDQLKWPEQVKTMQRNWIGRSTGLEIHFKLLNHPEPLKIFTTRPDTLMGINFIAIAPEHPLAIETANHDPLVQQFLHDCHLGSVSEATLATLEKKGVPTQLKALHPITMEEIPIWIANYVLMDYGQGALMSVAAHDERDFEFSQKFNIPFKPVIQPSDNNWDFEKKPYMGAGVLINSGEWNGETSSSALEKISNYLINNGIGKKITQYRLRDWGISRQRYWGTPIPMIHCSICGEVPVNDEDLPVILPEYLVPNGSHSVLEDTPEFYQTHCPKCGQPARRETETFDTFLESSWYYARYACPDLNTQMLDERANYWLPVDQYVGGIEHAVMHLLYARFIHKAMRDLKLINSDEPFTRLLTQGMVLKDGAKMSKSKGNTVSPQVLIEQYGADTVRLFSIFAAPPEQSLEWSDSGVEGAYRFLKRLWSLAESHLITLKQFHKTPESNSSINSEEDKSYRHLLYQILNQADYDMQRQQFNTVVSAAMKMMNLIAGKTNFSQNVPLLQESISILLRLLYPIVPHVTEYLWHELGYGDSIEDAKWPIIDLNALETNSFTLVIQINGKRRGEISVEENLSEAQIKEKILSDERIKPYLNQQSIEKIIVVPKKLVNVVTKNLN